MDSATEMKLLDFLRQTDEEWTETLKLAKAVGKTSKSDVNPTLYRLEKQGQVLKDPKSTKPRWQICGKPPASPSSPSLPAPPAPPPPREEATDTILPPPVTDITDVNDVAPAAVSAGYYNPKGTLQEKFGEHAVEWKQLGTGTSFQYEVVVASMTILGPVRGTKAAAQQSAAQEALVALAERPELVPQEAPSDTDFKSKLEVFSANKISCKYDTKKCHAGGFESTVSATGAAASSTAAVAVLAVSATGRGRRKIDAEHFAARALLEKLREIPEVKPMASMASAPDDSPRDDVSRKDREGRSGAEVAEDFFQLQTEAFQEQAKEHEKLKELLRPLNLDNFAKIRQNMAPCISEAFRLKLIDDAEKKRLQEINMRGNCAKHTPERLRPKAENGQTVTSRPEDSDESW